MATVEGQHLGTFSEHGGRKAFAEFAAGWTTEAVGGAVAIVLAILGIAGVESTYLIPIATIALAMAFVVEGGFAMARFADAQVGTTHHHGGLTVEFLGGAAGIVMGILALVGVVPQTLMAAAVLMFGTAMLLSCGAGFGTFEFEESKEHPHMHEMAREAMFAASGAKAFVALAAIVMGILALTHVAPVMLTLIAQLILGGSFFLSGSAMTTNWFTRWSH